MKELDIFYGHLINLKAYCGHFVTSACVLPTIKSQDDLKKKKIRPHYLHPENVPIIPHFPKNKISIAIYGRDQGFAHVANLVKAMLPYTDFSS